jgi:hypothetical protein
MLEVDMLRQAVPAAAGLARRIGKRQGFSIAVVWGLAGVIFLGSLAAASQRPLWFDELVTLRIAQSGSYDQMGAAVKAGADTLPPYFHWLLSAMLRLPLPEEISIRLLPALGIAGGFLCLYFLLRPACGAVAALAGAVFPLAAEAMRFAWEARPYGILFGLTAAAGLAWRHAGQGAAGAALLFAALATAVLIHPFAVLTIAAIAAAEAAAAIRRRRWRLPVWLALAAAALTLLADLPYLLATQRTFSRNFFVSASFAKFFAAWKGLMQDLWPLVVWILIWCTVALPGRKGARSVAGSAAKDRDSDAFAETALGLSLFVLLPLAAWAALRFGGGGLVSRYILPATIGAGILVGVALSRVSPRHRAGMLAGLLLIVFLKIYPLFRGLSLDRSRAQNVAAAQVLALVGSRGPGPVLISNAELFLSCWRSARPEMAGRLSYAADPEYVIAAGRPASVEFTMMGLRRVWDGSIISYGDFRGQNSRFAVVAGRRIMLEPFEWLIPRLLGEGCRLTLEERLETFDLFAVSCGPEGPATAER